MEFPTLLWIDFHTSTDCVHGHARRHFLVKVIGGPMRLVKRIYRIRQPRNRIVHLTRFRQCPRQINENSFQRHVMLKEIKKH
jgi:hypothetical protein